MSTSSKTNRAKKPVRVPDVKWWGAVSVNAYGEPESDGVYWTTSWPDAGQYAAEMEGLGPRRFAIATLTIRGGVVR